MNSRYYQALFLIIPYKIKDPRFAKLDSSIYSDNVLI